MRKIQRLLAILARVRMLNDNVIARIDIESLAIARLQLAIGANVFKELRVLAKQRTWDRELNVLVLYRIEKLTVSGVKNEWQLDGREMNLHCTRELRHHRSKRSGRRNWVVERTRLGIC